MKKILAGAITLALGAGAQGFAQSLEELNIQIHGYATQGFLYSTNNNIFTTNSSNGSPAWTEAVVNVTAQPDPKLRIGVQARYFLLGNLGNAITLDWASADYKPDDKFGVRFGKVKTPSGLFNEIQDIDPGYLWALLPQTIYPITSRNSLLAHYGGVGYGTIKLGQGLGKLEYRGWAGLRSIGPDDGYFVVEREEGLLFTNGVSSVVSGEALHWRTPLAGLMIGASNSHSNASTSAITDSIAGLGTFNGSLSAKAGNSPSFFGQYDKSKLMVAGEYSRQVTDGSLRVPPLFTEPVAIDWRAWYAMASYKVTDKLSAGAYDTQLFDRQAALGPARYLKDWVVSARYDFNQFLYAKAEQHFMDGTGQGSGYDLTLNPPTAQRPTGLEPNTKLTILKVGVSF
jgi:hypothetical protein